jgi:hypothetical protein
MSPIIPEVKPSPTKARSSSNSTSCKDETGDSDAASEETAQEELEQLDFKEVTKTTDSKAPFHPLSRPVFLLPAAALPDPPVPLCPRSFQR